jgi:hypothetical protein
MNTRWLKTVCDSRLHVGDLSRPMLWTRDGKDFTIASDATRIVELPGVHGALAQPAEHLLPGLRKYLAPTPTTAVSFDWGAFHQFIIDQLAFVARRKEAQVYIGGVLFNAVLFKPMVLHLPPTQTARWAQQTITSFALVDGGDWRFAIMPMFEKLGQEGTKSIPRFDIEGVRTKAA